MTIAQQVVNMRKLKGLEIEEFALIVGLDSKTISQLEQGLIDPTISTLEKITSTFNWSFKIGDVSI
ncbi:helix-turn-helix domain-containing protein [Pseudoneobacillus sp. C159]